MVSLKIFCILEKKKKVVIVGRIFLSKQKKKPYNWIKKIKWNYLKEIRRVIFSYIMKGQGNWCLLKHMITLCTIVGMYILMEKNMFLVTITEMRWTIFSFPIPKKIYSKYFFNKEKHRSTAVFFPKKSLCIIWYIIGIICSIIC